MPDGYAYLQLTATPTAGSGSITATPGLVTGRPIWVHRTRYTGLVLDCPASATLGGQAAVEFSPNVNNGNQGLGQLPDTSAPEPAIWLPAVDGAGDAISIGALAASTGQTIALRLGALELIALRAKFTPSEGYGRYRAILNTKG